MKEGRFFKGGLNLLPNSKGQKLNHKIKKTKDI